MSSDSAMDLITQLSQFTSAGLSQDAVERQKALELSKKLTAVLESPANRATELIYKPMTLMAARVAIDLDLFNILAQHDIGPISTADLAAATSGEELLISRMLRTLASIDFLEERGPDLWMANETTRAMSRPPIAAGHRFCYDSMLLPTLKAPAFLHRSKFRSPADPMNGFVQYGHQTMSSTFSFIAEDPTRFTDFNLFMGHVQGAREPWLDWYDVPSTLISGFDAATSPVLLVDVGGGKGHDIQAFVEKYGDEMRGDVVLQDLPSVIAGIKANSPSTLSPRIRLQDHDFFTSQPVVGARAYFLHHVLHDWSDDHCIRILAQLRDTMTPGYSRLLIHELIFPDQGAGEMAASFDLMMMVFNCGVERSERQWRGLIAKAGLQVTKVWSRGAQDGIIEVERVS
ncbi:sterigmatocystin 8-O-methyltransferase [Polyplosphaeria fusca]|uniref:Sterigmatocystin 8-O-methyltransferase n=1 Tax=Polyplosphaeria fusca TaxID=682080 RepID=A0A9P4RAX6_9PLEO|nr:sterigmatocystin 8-O-methyltransferase [Polyplosphaeria fusca]